jgi:hypothetical protein
MDFVRDSLSARSYRGILPPIACILYKGKSYLSRKNLKNPEHNSIMYAYFGEGGRI